MKRYGRAMLAIRKNVAACGNVAIALTLLLGASVDFASAQSMGSGLMPANVARRYGLERAWHTQVEVGRSRGRVNHVVVHVSVNRTQTIVEVFQGPTRWLFTEHDRDAFQQPIGPKGVQTKAEEFLAKLKKHRPEAGEPRMELRVVPEVTVYATTDQAVLHAIDGETGKTRWVTKVGDANLPTTAAAANEKYVTLLNGSHVYCVDARDGDVKWQRKVSGVPGAGPAMTDAKDQSPAYVFCPMVNGAIESFTIEDPKAEPWIYRSLGRAMVQPAVGFDALAWPTDHGHLYVASPTGRAIRYRLEAKETIVASPTVAAPDRIIAPSVDGYIYCLHPSRQQGNIHWKYSTGETLSQPVTAVGDVIYAISDERMLYCVGLMDGLLRWKSPYLKKMLTVSAERIYAVGDVGQLVILDRKTGNRIATLPMDEFDLQIVNPLTDRIYYGTKQGTIQCLREIDHPWPLVHSEAKKPAPRPRPSAKPAAKPGANANGAPAEDPFGGAPAAKPAAGANEDPFAAPAPAGGGGAKPAANDDDPFGGGGNAAPAKPAPKPKDDSDPFG